jgi:exocyst complex protein 7
VVAFQSFAALEARKMQFEQEIRHKAGRKENELGDLLHALRATCLTSLPEFLEEVKVGLNPLCQLKLD